MAYNTFYNWNYQQNLYQQNIVDQAKGPRIVMINERDPESALKKITQWLSQHYPGLRMNQIAVVKPDRRVYARGSFRTANGQKKVILFDVTNAVESHMNTSIRMFSPGTVIRIWPGSGSKPTREQILV